MTMATRQANDNTLMDEASQGGGHRSLYIGPMMLFFEIFGQLIVQNKVT